MMSGTLSSSFQYHLEQVLATVSLAKSGLPPVFVNKVLLEHSQAHMVTYCQWLLLCCAEELRGHEGDCVAQKT